VIVRLHADCRSSAVRLQDALDLAAELNLTPKVYSLRYTADKNHYRLYKKVAHTRLPSVGFRS